jgi:hypothetical protein
LLTFVDPPPEAMADNFVESVRAVFSDASSRNWSSPGFRRKATRHE